MWVTGGPRASGLDDTVARVLSAAGGHAWLVGERGTPVEIQEWDGQAWRAHQPPAECELRIDTSIRSVTDATDEIERMLGETGILFDELVDLAANI